MGDLLIAFGRTVCDAFGLGDFRRASIGTLPGNANRLWTFDFSSDRYVVKEFRYTIRDALWVSSIRQGAQFEAHVWESGEIPMAEPILGRSGEFIVRGLSSRGTPGLVRVHRWRTGRRVRWPVDEPAAAAAGTQLAAIQHCGMRYAERASVSLRWWRWEPQVVLEGLRRRGFLADGDARSAAGALERTEQLVALGQGIAGTCSFSHFDHKPDNVLWCDETFCVLDWDEAAPCHPRLEAAEAALRWAGIEQGTVSPELFLAFVTGYRLAGGDPARFQARDFAKYAAGLLGWFDYHGRRALGEFGDLEQEMAAAARTARATLADIEFMFDQLHSWCSLDRS